MGLMPLSPDDPTEAGPYRLVARLGVGGMGVVYLGADAAHRPAAVKIMLAAKAVEPRYRSRFRREVALAADVESPHVVRVLAADAEAEAPWIATEYVPGPNLTELVTANGPLSPEAAAELARDLAAALRAIHDAGVVHRDLKPGNVVLGDDAAKIIDFGIADLISALAVSGAEPSPELEPEPNPADELLDALTGAGSAGADSAASSPSASSPSASSLTAAGATDFSAAQSGPIVSGAAVSSAAVSGAAATRAAGSSSEPGDYPRPDDRVDPTATSEVSGFGTTVETAGEVTSVPRDRTTLETTMAADATPDPNDAEPNGSAASNGPVHSARPVGLRMEGAGTDIAGTDTAGTDTAGNDVARAAGFAAAGSGTGAPEAAVDGGSDRPAATTWSGDEAPRLGTIGYVAPEIAAGTAEGTPASDVYSWGLTVAFAATGRPPFGEGSVEEVLARTEQADPDLDGVPEDLLAVVHDALRTSPGDRPDAAELLRRLTPDLAPDIARSGTGLTDPAGPFPPQARHRRHRARRPRAAAAAAVVFLGIAAAIAVLAAAASDNRTEVAGASTLPLGDRGRGPSGGKGPPFLPASVLAGSARPAGSRPGAAGAPASPSPATLAGSGPTTARPAGDPASPRTAPGSPSQPSGSRSRFASPVPAHAGETVAPCAGRPWADLHGFRFRHHRRGSRRSTVTSNECSV